MGNLWAVAAYGLAAAGSVGIFALTADNFAGAAARHLSRTILTTSTQSVRPQSRVEKRLAVLEVAFSPSAPAQPAVQAMTPPAIHIGALAAALDRAEHANTAPAPASNALNSAANAPEATPRVHRSGSATSRALKSDASQTAAVNAERRQKYASLKRKSVKTAGAVRTGKSAVIAAARTAVKNKPGRTAKLDAKSIELAVFKNKSPSARAIPVRLAETPGELMYDRFIRHRS